MQLSTSTNIHQVYRDNNYYIDAKESIQKCAEAGYKVLDISLNSVSYPGRPMSMPNWKDWVYSIKEQFQKYNITPSQSHAFYYAHSKDPFGNVDLCEELIHRGIEASGILGVKWVVMHPIHGVDTEGKTISEAIKMNAEYFKGYEEFAAHNGVGIAIENMIKGHMVSADELLELLDVLDSPVFGTCWDTGHANLSGQNQGESILKMGKKLKALHIADNNGRTDEHLAPLYGTINWEEVIKALRSSGYEGDFTYEIHRFTYKLPPDMRDTVLKFTCELGNYLLNTY
jgi:L-ribulose-5-phosphate 3-epimerase